MSLSMRARGWRSTIAPQVQARGLRGPLARPVANVNVAVTAETLQARVELLEHENLALKKQVAALRGIPLEEVQSFPDEGPATADAASPSSAASAAAAAPAPALAAVDNVLWPTPGEKFWERPVQASYSPLAGASAGNAAAVTKDARPLKVVHITAEMAPIAKVRGRWRCFVHAYSPWQAMRVVVVCMHLILRRYMRTMEQGGQQLHEVGSTG